MQILSTLIFVIIVTQVILAVLCIQFELELTGVLALFQFSISYSVFLLFAIFLAIYMAWISLTGIANRRAGQRNNIQSERW